MILKFFLGHEILKLYFYWSKNSHRAPKYLFLKILVENFHTQFLKQWMFEASEALHKVEDTKKKMSFHQYSWNSEVETSWISLIGWPYYLSFTYYSFYFVDLSFITPASFLFFVWLCSIFRLMNSFHKVHIFWEGLKILWNLHLTFDYSTYSQK